MKRLRRFVLGIAALGAVTACTPQQIADWVAWNDRDPVAAQEFANLPAVQDHLRLDTDHDGVVEPDAPARRRGVGASGGGGGNSAGGTVWDRLAQCESGGNWAINTGNGYSGGLQFLHSSWRAYGGSGQAWQHSRAEQIVVAQRILNDVGWGAWPACSRKLGLR